MLELLQICYNMLWTYAHKYQVSTPAFPATSGFSIRLSADAWPTTTAPRRSVESDIFYIETTDGPEARGTSWYNFGSAGQTFQKTSLFLFLVFRLFLGMKETHPFYSSEDSSSLCVEHFFFSKFHRKWTTHSRVIGWNKHVDKRKEKLVALKLETYFV